MEVWLLILVFVLEAVYVSYLLWQYVNLRKTAWYVVFLTWIGWLFSFSVPILIPVDVTSTQHTHCLITSDESNCVEPWIQIDRTTLIYLWKVIYWTTYILCWTAYPLLQAYSTAGDFTVLERIRTALKENLIFYTVCGVVVTIFIVWISIQTNQLDKSGFYAVAIAAANAWGLFILMALLGYGLVEAPKALWRTANRRMTYKLYQFQAAILKEGYEKAKKELDSTLKLIRKYSDRVSETDPFRPFVDVIVKKCPMQFKDITRGEGDVDLSYQKLVNLHKRLINAEHEMVRSRVLYENLLNKAFELEDILRSAESPIKSVRWSFRPRRTHRFAAQVDLLEWIWKVYLEPRALQLLAIICGLFSVCVVWSEVVFSITAVDLSLFSLLLKSKISFTLEWVFVFVPIFYMAYCSYWSLFKLRLFNYYRLIPHHQTDANSILFSAAYLCRLAPSLAYNFLLMIHKEGTAFYDVVGALNPAPFLGSTYQLYAPTILIVLCLATLFNLYTKFVTNCCFARWKRRFVFEEDFSDSLIDRGREIIAHERELREKGLGISAERDFRVSSKTTPELPSKKNHKDNAKDKLIESNNSSSSSNGFPPFRKIFGQSPQDSPNRDRLGLLESGERGRSSQLYGSAGNIPKDDPFADFNNS